MLAADSTDATLVSASLAGNRDAFGQIVSRYQSLICSLAYSSTGSFGQSEDLAQETFITAWKHLGKLREPASLRSWLCGIARNCINNSLRRADREPIHGAQPLEVATESPEPQPLPAEQVITREEEAILWRSLERIPASYREPLVLFYREGESVQRVASELDLSEDAVKQRLSRGRKLLANEVAAFVEAALRQSAPGKAFTIGVLTALPVFSVSASAAAVSATAAKGSASAKAAGLIGIFGPILAPILSLLGTWLGYRMSLDDAGSEREREAIKGFYKRLTACLVGFFIVFALLVLNSKSILNANPLLFIGLLAAIGAAYVLAIILLSIWSFRVRRTFTDEASAVAAGARTRFEYRSRFELLGLPFVHVRLGGGIAGQPRAVKAWIAVGDCAVGVLFAFGGLAIAPFSLGGFAIGLLPFGGMAIGILALGGFSLGMWAFGGMAFGWQAYGGCAVAWSAAMGGIAVARDFALGAVAHATQVNNQAAQHYIQVQPFFQNAQVLIHHIAWINLLWFVPMLLWWRIIRSRRQHQQAPV